MKVKICGITNLEDALSAVALGADALGFVFAPESPRHISAIEAKKIISKLPPFITTVAVITASEIEDIQNLIALSGVHLIQFHGDFPHKTLLHFSHRAIQVIQVKDERSLKGFISASGRAILLDTYHEKVAGGSGIAFNWNFATPAKQFGKVILAGGLTSNNVKTAIQTVQPYGVDVSSGVERQKGKKDPRKMRAFISAAKEKGTGNAAATE